MSKKIVKAPKQEIVSAGPHFLDETQAYQFCQETTQLASGIKSAFMLLAQRLHRIERQKLYQPTYDHFYMYCDEIGIDKGTASKLTTIYEKFCREYEIPFEEVKDVEYTKLYLIKKVSETKELAYHWLDEIKSGLTVQDLKKRIAEVTTGVDQMECPHASTYLVRCCRECKETWEEFPDTTK